MANYKKTSAHKRSRNSKNFAALPVQGSLALSTLADDTVLKNNIHTGLFTEDFYAISADLQVMVRNLTSGEGEPSSWGLNHSDYSSPEVNENLNVSLLGPGNKIEQERSRRLVRDGGQLIHLTAEDELIPLDRSHRVKLKFVCQSGKALEIWFKNRSGSALTTGAILEWHGKVYGRWIL